jgi:cytochrome d ubiquinol oxidase subunit II
METIQVLQIIWFFLIGILLAGYSVLDGFDLGAGSLLPFLAGRDEKKAETIFRTIGPVWDGNEVWLITAGGALFAAFPHAYATVFSGFYLALMIVLLGLVLRAVSMEFFTLETKKRRIWIATFIFGSVVPALLFGIALGNVILGVPLDSRMEFTGTFFTLLRPFPICIGLLGFSAILMQGASYIALKTDGEIRQKAKQLSHKIWYSYAALFVVSLMMSFLYMPDRVHNIPAWISSAILLLMLVQYRRYISTDDDMKKFIFSSVAFIALWGIAGSVMFPALVKSAESPLYDITIYNASSGKLTLSVMLGIALVGMPIVIAYTVYVYRIFKGRVTH